MQKNQLLTRVEPVLGAGLIVVALLLARSRVGASIAVDFRAMWGAGDALLHARPLYGVPDFVYPPFAALVFVPFSELNYSNATYAYSILQVALPLGAALILGATLARRHRWLGAGVLAVLLLKADVYVDSLFIYNPSVLFVLPLIVTTLLWSCSRWRLGAVVLGISLAVKPLLLLLIVIPLLRRDGRTLTYAVCAAVLPTLLMLPFVHDLPGLLALPGRILHGTNLHGKTQVYNVSLGSVGIVHPSWQAAIVVLRLLLGCAMAFLLWRTRKASLSYVEMTVVAGALTLSLPVLGSLNEIHYCFLALPACAALFSGRMGRPARICGAVAFIVLWLPLFNLHINTLSASSAQLRWALGSALALLACCLARFSAPDADARLA